MKHTYLTLAIIALTLTVKGQHSLTLYNMNMIGQSIQINPSLIPENKMYFGLPTLGSTSFLYTNSAFNWRELHRVRPDDSVSMEVEYVIDKMPEKNYISASFRTNILEAGFTIKNNYFSVNISEKGSFNFTFPKELLQLAFLGNGAFIGQEVDLKSMSFDATHYREYAIGWARSINKKVSLGARFKYLYGMENISSAKSDLSFYTAPDDYSIQLTSDYVINTSFSGNPDNVNSGSYMLGLKNTGYAGDLGVTYKFNERWNFNASIIDLGFINWKSFTKNYTTASGSYTFSGLDINQFMNDSSASMDNVLDSISDSFEPIETYQSYKTQLPTHLYFNTSYRLDQKSTVSGLLHALVFQETVQPTLTASINRRFSDYFSLIVNYSIINHHYDNIGGGLAFSDGAFQFYVLSDNWLGTINPLSYNTANIQFGFNLIFGRHKTKTGDTNYGVKTKTPKTNTKSTIQTDPAEEDLKEMKVATPEKEKEK
jgi:hypothetical protein